jgi:hypothetical protein
MFYDAFAALINQSADAILQRQASPSYDPRSQREGRQIATFLRRTSAVWSDLFTTLGAETEALERGLEAANHQLGAQDLALIPAASSNEPLERYRSVNRALDLVIECLTPLSREPWAKDALLEIRASLAEASEIQGRLVDRMLEIR